MKRLPPFYLILPLLVSCLNAGQVPTLTPTGTPQPTLTSTPQIPERQYEITAIWEKSPHALAVDPVECKDCHSVENGIVVDALREGNPQTGQDEAGLGEDSICSQCHRVTSFGSAHPDFSCGDCHDPHVVKVFCTDSGCHSNIPAVFYELPATPTGGHPTNGSSFCGGGNCHSVATAVAQTSGSIHGPAHAFVNCEACHDRNLMKAGPSTEDGRWILLHENGSELPFSHDLQHEVDCSRCHFENNPWGLSHVIGLEFNQPPNHP
jgi:hypothetical protein